MKGALTCLWVCSIPLLATPISDQTAPDTAQTVYFRLRTNPQTFTPPNENGFYTATLPRTLDFFLTLSNNALTFPGYSEGTLLHAWLTLERTGPDTPVWQLTSPSGGTPHAPALTASALGPPFSQ